MHSEALNHLVMTATEAFNGRSPRTNVRLPNPLTQIGILGNTPYISPTALWTKDDARPRWDNLAAIVASIPDQSFLGNWTQALADLMIPLGVLAVGQRYICVSWSLSGAMQQQIVEPENLLPELKRRSENLFTPRALGALRTGQMSFADLEDAVTVNTFSYQSRHYANLGQSLKSAIGDALSIEWERGIRRKNSREGFFLETYDAVLRVGIAYLAARILEDKGFFGAQQLPTNDPQILLERTVSNINGFFQKALVEELPHLSNQALQHLALHLGSASTFTLVDHRQVGHLYEQAIQVLPPVTEGIEVVDLTAFSNLQRHYTPIAIAERMAQMLPLERLRPEDRRIFDPAAGSGSLLLAATERLSAMEDTPADKKTYLATNVSGNDLDPRAKLITEVRYTLARESEGCIFPSPSVFDNKDFGTFTRENLPSRARIILANPPFAEHGAVQIAAKFVEVMTNWLTDGDQFSVVLPHSFLRGSTHGTKEARKKLAESCHVFEVWQLPEGAVGLTAEQPVCVVLGEIGHKPGPSVARAVISRNEKKAVKEGGFLGTSWVTQIPEGTDSWSSAIAPEIKLTIPIVLLGNLFHVFTGVTLDKRFPPIGEVPKGVIGKPYWKREWKGLNRVWADPKRVNPEERFIRYGEEYLLRPKLADAYLFEKTKVLLGRVVNRDSADPLAARLDTSGFWPDVNVFCLCPLEAANKQISEAMTPEGWKERSHVEQLLWLLGILTSDIAKRLSLGRRESRYFVKERLQAFELPAYVDPQIVNVVRAMVIRDQERQLIPDPDPLRQELNCLVETSYGFPFLQRIGGTPTIDSWKMERKSNHLIVTGQVLDCDVENERILLTLDGIRDDRSEAWVNLPSELPGWALEGQMFTAQISEDIQTYEALSRRPWAMRRFKHTPRPYLTMDELTEEFAFISSS